MTDLNLELDPCPTCHGLPDDAEACPQCHGAGRILIRFGDTIVVEPGTRYVTWADTKWRPYRYAKRIDEDVRGTC